MSPVAQRLILSLILAAAAGIYLLGNSRAPLWDRDEPRYAQCSREMLQSGDWVVPRFLGQLRAHKPPLIYWCQAAAMSIFGPTGAAARLPSAAAVFLAAVLLAAFTRRYADMRRAIWATLVFSTTALTIAAAKFAITDGLLLLWICIGQGCLYSLWKRDRSSWPLVLIFWFSTALAGLTKGPVVLAMHAATLAIFAAFEVGDRWKSLAAWKDAIFWWPRLRPIPGTTILIAVVAPWLLLVNHRAPDFLPRMLNRAGRYATGGAEGHAHWPGFYLLLIWGTFFPWSLMLPTSIGMGIRHRENSLVRFALAAAIGPWLVMELVKNKLPFYILPSFPPLALLAAEAIVRCIDARLGSRDDDFKRRLFLVGVVIWIAAVQVVVVMVETVKHDFHWPRIIGPLWIACAELYVGLAIIAFYRRRVAFASAIMGIGMAALMIIFYTGLIPNVPEFSASREIGEQLKALGAGGATPVAMIEYREPSLAFYQGGGARESDATALSSSTPPRWAVLTTTAWSHLQPATQARYAIMNSPLRAFVYNDGWHFVDLIIIHLDPA